jgi:DNA polymerase beta
MSNNKIISEFERLIAFIESENDNANKNANTSTNTSINTSANTSTVDKSANVNKFKIKILLNVLNILKKYPEKITLDNLGALKTVRGVGKGSIDRIIEILTSGSLSELGNFKKKDLQDLESVVGIGHVHALELYDKGITTVKELKKQIKEGKISVNEKIELGLKYYGKFEGNIPRNEIKKVYKIIQDIIKVINKTLKEEEQYIFEICGSFRREKLTSGDIDILISKKGNLDENYNYLANIISLLKSPIKKNDDKPFLIDDLTDKNIHTKYMGFGKYLENPPRRIDIRFIPYESYYSALVYFTGPMELNKQMRLLAKSKKLKLSEYGLFKENGKSLPVNSELDVFKLLDMEYIEPKLR